MPLRILSDRKMKARRFIINFIIILAAAIAVFLIGWIQFYVKPGNFGIMVSKTGGVYEKPVVSGKFVWRWERLLPTNVDLRIFKLSPTISSQSVSGELPSAKIYSSFIQNKPDFSYSIQMRVSLSLTPEQILNAVKTQDIHDQQEMNAYLEGKAKIVSQSVAKLFLENNTENLPAYETVLSSGQIEKVVKTSRRDLDSVIVNEIELTYTKLPDIEVYNAAKESFLQYQKSVNQKLEARAAEQAKLILEDERTLKKLEKFGEILQRYPQLEELSKSGDITAVMNSLRNNN